MATWAAGEPGRGVKGREVTLADTFSKQEKGMAASEADRPYRLKGDSTVVFGPV